MKAFLGGTTAASIGAKKGWRFKVVRPVAGLNDYDIGDTVTVKTVKPDSWGAFFKTPSGAIRYIWWSELAPFTKTWETLAKGDVLTFPGRGDKLVEGVLGDVVFYTLLSGTISFDSLSALRKYGWVIKDTQPEEVELTLAEVAEKFNVPLDKLRIKGVTNE